MHRRTALKTLAAGAATLAAPMLRAEEDRSPVTILVGAASSMDFTARLLAEYLREPLGRPVIVVSKLGAGGRLALNELKRAAPDGRTLMFSTSSAFAIVDFPEPDKPVKNTVNPCCARGGYDLRSSVATSGKVNHSGISRPCASRSRSCVPEMFAVCTPSGISSSGMYSSRSGA